ncbi:hypothetical protein FACS1894172_01930 [Spirochaetia bacterium]|nr:hypothetical protein FACS1894172_01930 [Spirochaetia bacterium]
MATIDFSSPLLTSFSANLNTNSKKSAPASKSRFFRIFERAEESAAVSEAGADPPLSEDTIQNLLDEIHSAGDDLRNRPFPEEIRRYKQAVRNFLYKIVKNGYTTHRQISGINLAKRKRFTLVQVVDQKLEQLAAGIMAGQITQLNILARLEEIKGLLVDIFQ